MSERHARLRTAVNATLLWVSLLYGLIATAVEPAWSHDEMQIVLGAETVVLALVGFLWAGRRRPLGAALILTGTVAPLSMLGAATIYWDDPYALDGEGLWTSLVAGLAIGVPLVLLGVHALRRLGDARRPDRWWLVLARSAVFAGVWLVVLAFRGGDWDRGVVLVYVGAAAALIGLIVGLGYRFRVGVRGLGLLLLALGLTALAVTGLALVMNGGRMSGEEAALGLMPAAVVTVVGAVMSRLGSRPTLLTSGHNW
jgi:hypothetical protein